LPQEILTQEPLIHMILAGKLLVGLQSSNLHMGTLYSSKVMANVYKKTWYNIPEYSSINILSQISRY